MRQNGCAALIEQGLSVVRLVGDATMARHALGNGAGQQKADLSPLTEAGLAVHQVPLNHLEPLVCGQLPRCDEPDTLPFPLSPRVTRN